MTKGDNTLTLKRIDGKDKNGMKSISPRIRDDLKYQLGEWLVENRQKIQEKNRLKEQMAQTKSM